MFEIFLHTMSRRFESWKEDLKVGKNIREQGWNEQEGVRVGSVKG
jgi:hypothetical protein